MKKYFLLFLFLFTFTQVEANNPDEILDRVKSKFDLVKDYRVDVNIKVDVDFLKVPEAKAEILFKQPDKVKINSEGFALLPKEGLNFSPNFLLSKNFTSIYEKEEIIDGKKFDVIKIIPLGVSSEIILSTLWIEQGKYLIHKVESTTKLNGTFTLELSYDDKFKYPLPTKMIFKFDASRINIPRGMSGDASEERPRRRRNENRMTQGIVTITYSNYEVNVGLDDKLFDEKKK